MSVIQASKLDVLAFPINIHLVALEETFVARTSSMKRKSKISSLTTIVSIVTVNDDAWHSRSPEIDQPPSVLGQSKVSVFLSLSLLSISLSLSLSLSLPLSLCHGFTVILDRGRRSTQRTRTTDLWWTTERLRCLLAKPGPTAPSPHQRSISPPLRSAHRPPVPYLIATGTLYSRSGLFGRFGKRAGPVGDGNRSRDGACA